MQFSIYRNGALALALGLLLSSGIGPSPSFRSSHNGRGPLNPLAIVAVEAFTVERRPDAHDIKRIVFGTAALSKAADPASILDAAYSKGFRRFDLAHTYGGGESERIFGRWLESRTGLGRVNRDELNIITKGGIGDDAFGDPDRPLLTRECLLSEVDESLNALKVTHVDLYMYHRDDPRLPVENFVDWMNQVLNSGKVKRWGVSNWTFERFKAAHSYAKANGLVPPSANSPQYSLAAPAGEIWPSTYSISAPENEEEIDWYQDRGIELLCWEVLAKGFMAKSDLWPEHEVDPATFSAPVTRGSDEWRLQRIQRAYCNSENYRRRHLAVQLAELTGCKLAQIAMLYPLTRGRHISVIFGSSKVDHLDDMVALRHMNIDDEAMMLLAGRQEAVKEEKGFAFVPQLLGLGRNNVMPAIKLSAKAREAKLAAERRAVPQGASSAPERTPVAFTAGGRGRSS